MRKLLVILLITATLSSCKNRNGNSGTSDSLAPKIELTEAEGEKVMKFNTLLAKLDSTDAQSISAAVRQYKEIFQRETKSACDNAFVLLFNFYDDVATGFNKVNEINAPLYDSLMMEFDKPVVLSQRLMSYKAKLTANGLEPAMNEGMFYARKNWKYMESEIGSLLSPAMNEFIGELEREEVQAFASDGGLIISPSKLADRIVWWDNFIAAHPDFVLRRAGVALRKIYRYFFLTGLENTPLLETGSKKVKAEFSEGFEYVISKYPSTETAALTKPYYEHLKKGDTSNANALIRKYAAEGKVFNGSNE